ncbi:ComF family protein [Ornithinibacillus sp. L9]|uniref:ComF family protein n=1 Tax=Ornithinibacillus caprae TaxID=2678566 RepID=A0A6N8FS54_9BACI|nr:ComF family protein [Ornithinibacillus caprae]MUK90808.1 ComF family protein [Ornithinibacillus caprae]
MNCLWCDEEITSDVTWSNVALPTKAKSLCEGCEKELTVLNGSRCLRCSRVSEEKICKDCKWWEHYMGGEDVLTANYSVFAYNERMQDMIAKWKYRGDYQIGFAFQGRFTQLFKKQFNDIKNIVAVPIPLSKERMNERRFNQAEMLAHFLPIEVDSVLDRVHGEKQSKKNRYQRLSSENPFKLQKAINKPVILVDDIYTTGTTLRHAARLLQQHGCPITYAYTLIRG